MSKFVKPTPNKAIIHSLTFANKFINLYGFPILRVIPFLNKIPGIKGFCRIGEINFSDKDRVTLRQYLNSQNGFFIVPNHPELYTDWMIDKYICGKYAPQTACWATHEIVNGMGPKMQKFWLNNNLVAAIPGTGNDEAKQYSIDSALRGDGVLLHPEGKVSWTSDVIQNLFSGSIEMAKKVAEQKKTYLVPIVWKLKFTKNVEKKLHQEIDYIENYFKSISSQNKPISQRLVDIHIALFDFISNKHCVKLNSNNLFELILVLINKANDFIGAEYLPLDVLNFATLEVYWKTVKRKSLNTQLEEGNKKQFKSLNKTINSLFIFKINCYSKELTQEHIAECLQRIRVEFLNKGFRNKFHQFVPIPIEKRVALMKVCEPILITPQDDTNQKMDKLKNTLQANLNQLIERNHDKFIYYQNLLPSLIN